MDAGGGGGSGDGGGESEDGGYPSALEGGEMSGLMDKLLGECSKWLEIFTPQVLLYLLMPMSRRFLEQELEGTCVTERIPGGCRERARSIDRDIVS